jgi:hypothetical protein
MKIIKISRNERNVIRKKKTAVAAQLKKLRTRRELRGIN